MGRVRYHRSTVAAFVTAAACAASLTAQSTPPPASTSMPPAKELVSLLEARKLEAFAVRDEANAGQFIAALHIPGVQLLVVSAVYKRPSDIDYRLYHKDYMSAYQDLRSGILADNRIIIEDISGDGLLAIPRKDTGRDTFTVSGAARVFDGDFADPRRKNQKKISQEDYFKAYGDADARYAKLLETLLVELKKQKMPGGVAPVQAVR
jgi:lipoprotein-anchoring transpeptidase ErfK/SrfK